MFSTFGVHESLYNTTFNNQHQNPLARESSSAATSVPNPIIQNQLGTEYANTTTYSSKH